MRVSSLCPQQKLWRIPPAKCEVSLSLSPCSNTDSQWQLFRCCCCFCRSVNAVCPLVQLSSSVDRGLLFNPIMNPHSIRPLALTWQASFPITLGTHTSHLIPRLPPLSPLYQALSPLTPSSSFTILCVKLVGVQAVRAVIVPPTPPRYNLRNV